MSDINELQYDDEAVEIDHENYVDPSEISPPMPAGIYTLRAGKPDYDVGGEGFPVAIFDHAVEGGPEEGKQVRFDRISTKPFLRRGITVSFALDFLRACGDASRPKTKRETLECLGAQEGKLFKAQVDWEAYCKSCENSIKGMRDFPFVEGSETEHQSRIECPTAGCTNEKGEPNLIYGNARIQRYIPA